jgi:hypothetical protein
MFHLSRGGIVSVLLVLATGLDPVNAQDSRRNMFEGLFTPPLRTPPSFSRPEATASSSILLESSARAPEADSAAENEAPSAPAEPSQTAATAKTQTQERSTSGNPTRPPWADAVKESSIQRRQGTQPSQVHPTRRLGAKPIRGRKEAKSHAQASGSGKWAKTDQPTRATRIARTTAPARIEFAPRAAPQLPHGLLPRHARRE